MKRILVVFSVVALTATAAALARPSALPTKKAGQLIVGFDVPAPGFWNGRVSGTTIKHPTGFEAGVAVAIAKQLGLKTIQYKRAPFGGLFSPAAKPYDFALEEVTITAQRAKVVAFSSPYFAANQGVLIRKGLSPKPKRISDLKRLQTCAQANTTGLAYILHTLRPAKKPLIYSASNSSAFDAVEARHCDALILDVPIVVSQSQTKRGAYGGVIGQIVTNESYGAVMDKGSKLKRYVDRAISALQKNGTISKLQKQWLPFTQIAILK